MGGRASKNDGSDYILSLEGDENGYSDLTKPIQSPSIQKIQGRKSLNKVSPVDSPNGDVSPLQPESGGRQNRAPSLGNISRQNSRKMSDTGNSSGSRSIASISRSVAGSGNAQSTSKVATSSTLKWIVKGGNFNNMTLQALEFGRIIGTGLMGVVRVCKLAGKNQYCAVKSVRKDYINKRNDARHVLNEKQLMEQLCNPFCIKLFKTYQDASNIYFVMELAVGGELFRRLNKKCSFPPQVTKFYVYEIFSALEHVQQLGYVYRDLKPENVMLDEDGHCKLVDFGFSIQPDGNGIVKTLCGTPAYLSPEQLDGKFTNGYSKIVDWWALGILIYELMTGLTPFCKNNSETHYEIYLRILKNKISFPRCFDNDSRDLVQRLCHADVKERLCAAEAIACHDYFTIPFEPVRQRKLIPPFVPRIKDESDRDHYFNKYSEPPEPNPNGAGNWGNIDGF